MKRILFQKITDKGDELIKAFQLLDPSRSMTVSKSELRRVVGTFLLPLTREQFQDVLAQVGRAPGGSGSRGAGTLSARHSSWGGRAGVNLGHTWHVAPLQFVLFCKASSV